MPTFFAPLALLPTGWSRDVRITADSRGRILAVEAGEDSNGAEYLGEIVVPGLPNLHSHAFQRGMVGLAERRVGEDSFWRWREVMYDFLQNITPDAVSAIAAKTYVDMTKAGYTSVAEFHYLHHSPGGKPYDDPAEMSLQIMNAARRSGIRLTHLPTVYASGGFGGAPLAPRQERFRLDARGALDLLQRLEDLALDDPRLSIGLAFHSLRAVPPRELMAGLAGVSGLAVVNGIDMPVHMHIAEQTREVEECVAETGARPVEWLLDNADVNGNWCLVHATHMTPSETEALARSGAVAGLCPTTEANLGDGIFPLEAYLARGGRFGIGSDSQVGVDPAEELRWLEYGQRLALGRRNIAAGGETASTGRALLDRAWAGGARALGLSVSGLAPGGLCDLLVLDPEHSNLVGRDEDFLLDSWIFSGGESPILHVMVGGEWVVRDRHHPQETEVEAIYRVAIRRLI